MKRKEEIPRMIIEILLFEVIDRAIFLLSLLFKFPLLEIMSFANKNEKKGLEMFYFSFLSGNLLSIKNKLREKAKLGHAFRANNLCFNYIHKKKPKVCIS